MDDGHNELEPTLFVSSIHFSSSVRANVCAFVPPKERANLEIRRLILEFTEHYLHFRLVCVTLYGQLPLVTT